MSEGGHTHFPGNSQNHMILLHAGAPGMHDSAWCNEAPVVHQDMVEGRFSHVPARAAP